MQANGYSDTVLVLVTVLACQLARPDLFTRIADVGYSCLRSGWPWPAKNRQKQAAFIVNSLQPRRRVLKRVLRLDHKRLILRIKTSEESIVAKYLRWQQNFELD